MYSVQCAVYSVQCTVCRVQCTVYSVQCVVCSVQCTVCSVVCSVQCVVCSVVMNILSTCMWRLQSMYTLLLHPGLTEIHNWLVSPWNKAELILLHVNDEGQQMDWDHLALIQQPIKDIFKDILFTPVDKQEKFPSRW